MKKRLLSFLLIVALVINIVGCDNAENLDNKQDSVATEQGTAKEGTATVEDTATDSKLDTNVTDETVKLSSEYEKMTFANPNTKIASFTIDDEGNVYAITQTGTLKKYKSSGKSIKTYDGHEGLSSLYYYNSFIYGYDTKAHKILQINTEDNTENVIYENLEAFDIKNLVVLDGSIYLLIVPAYISNPVHNDLWYIDFDEYILKIDIATKEAKSLEIENPIAIYGGDALYVYTFTNSKYALNKLDGDSLKEIAPMNDVGYVLSFIFEKDMFTYIDRNLRLETRKLNDDMVYMEKEQVPIQRGNDLQFFAGNAVFLTLTVQKIPESELKEVPYLVNLDCTYLNKKRDDNPSNKEPGTLTLYGGSGEIDVEQMEKITGIPATTVPLFLEDQKMLTKILAKDDDIDIYFMSTGFPVAKFFKDNGVYVDLSKSEIVTSYVNQCLDYIKDSTVNSNGDIWGLPFNAKVGAIFYNPNYFEQFDVSINNMKLYDGFLEELAKLDEKKGDLKIYGSGASFARHLSAQYDYFYNDFSNQKVDYNTDLYKTMFETMYSGWHNDLPESENYKHFRMAYLDYGETDHLQEKAYENNVEHVILNDDGIQRHLNCVNNPLEIWRALPCPYIGEKVDKELIRPTYAIINPYSKNIDLAIKYVEAMAQNVLTVTDYVPLFFNDINIYADKYDISKPVFTDIYNIYKNGVTVFGYIPARVDQYITDYQYGKTTLDEAIAELQHYTEMALNE